MMRSIFRDETVERDMGEGFFHFRFERSPDFARLTVARLETGECAFDEWSGEFERTVEYFLDFPDSDCFSWFGEGIAARHTFFRFDEAGSPQLLDDFFQIVFWEVLGFCQGMDGKRLLCLRQSENGPETVVRFFGHFHTSTGSI